MTKSERNQTLKREDTISNSEVHLSKIGPAQVRKNIRVKAGFELATFRLRKRIQHGIAASEREVAFRTLCSIPGEFRHHRYAHTDARSAKKDVISTKPQKAMGAERTFPREDKKKD